MFPRASLDQADHDAADALAIYARAGDCAGRSRCLAASSNLHTYRGDYPTATAIAAEGVDLAEAAHDEIAIAWAYGSSLDAAEDLDAARPHLTAALALAHQTGADWRTGRLLQRAAFIAIDNGRYGEAQLLHAEALQPARLAEDHECVADIHGNQAMACLLTGDEPGAARAAAEQLKLARNQRVRWVSHGLLIAVALAAQRDLVDDAAALDGAAEAQHRARVRYRTERVLFRHITENHIEKLRASQPSRWTLGVERGRSMTFDAVVNLALEVCDPAPVRS